MMFHGAQGVEAHDERAFREARHQGGHGARASSEPAQPQVKPFVLTACISRPPGAPLLIQSMKLQQEPVLLLCAEPLNEVRASRCPLLGLDGVASESDHGFLIRLSKKTCLRDGQSRRPLLMRRVMRLQPP